jgi:hypothetical protein
MGNILIYSLIASKIIVPFTDIYCLSLILRFIKDNKAYRHFMLGVICLFLLAITLTKTFRDISFLKSGAEIEALKKLLK